VLNPELLISKALRCGTCYTVLPASHTFTHKWKNLHLPLLISRRASLHFPVLIFYPAEVGGWVGLGGWLHTEL